jgi:hypothetical protein
MMGSQITEKHEWRRICREIQSVLLNVWDPIGVKNEPTAQDEYDAYVGHIFTLLTQGKTDKEIAEYLLWAVNEHIGLTGTANEALRTVRELRRIQLPKTG